MMKAALKTEWNFLCFISFNENKQKHPQNKLQNLISVHFYENFFFLLMWGGGGGRMARIGDVIKPFKHIFNSYCKTSIFPEVEVFRFQVLFL